MSNDHKYYPALSDRITFDDLPDFLNFIKELIQPVLNKVYYKNYYASKNATGSRAFYSMDIVPRTRISQELFGTGLSLVLNPDYKDNTISSFPITIFWQWEVLRYIKGFKSGNFSYTPEAFFNLAIDILGISKEEILEAAVRTFVISDELSPFEQLLSDINTLYGTAIDIDEFVERFTDAVATLG